MRKPLLKSMGTLFLLIFILLISTTALADSFAEPEPSMIEIENGNKVFYMTPPEYIGDKYPQSGLYYNTSPPEVIYVINSEHSGISYFSPGNVFISDDGMHFAHLPIPWHNDNVPWNNTESWQVGQEDFSEYTTTVLEFYGKGALVKKYTVSDLVIDNSKLEFSVTMVGWEMGNARSFDSESNTLLIRTVDGNTYTFDITTGAILESDREDSQIITNVDSGISEMNYEQSASGNFMPNDSLLWIVLGVLSVTLIIILVVIIKKRSTSYD